MYSVFFILNFSTIHILTVIPIGRGPIKADALICNGTENNLDECLTEPINDTLCDHVDDIGVECEGTWKSHKNENI